MGATETDCDKSIGSSHCWPMSNEAIAGTDYASPENSCFNEASVAERLKQHFDIVVNAATNGDVDKVFRSHCGEGFALYDKGKYFKYYKSGVTAFWDNTWANKYNDKNENKFLLKEGELGKLCKTVKKNYKDQKHIQLVHCGYFPLSGDMMPCHVIVSRHNMDVMATGIAKRRKELKEERKKVHRVTVRFGHATWATYEIAQKMREAMIQADCNLASNLATQAYPWPIDENGNEYERPAFLFGDRPGGQAVDVHDMDVVYNFQDDPNSVAQKKLLVQGHQNHGFLRLFIAGVKVELGSDGSGIEHSKNAVDYKIAKILIDSLTYYKQVCWNDEKEGENVDGCGGVVSETNWQWKLLNKWKEDTGPKLLLKDWTIEKLLSYGKERLEVMTIDESKKLKSMLRANKG